MSARKRSVLLGLLVAVILLLGACSKKVETPTPTVPPTRTATPTMTVTRIVTATRRPTRTTVRRATPVTTPGAAVEETATVSGTATARPNATFTPTPTPTPTRQLAQPGEAYSQPHPTLSDPRVRQAIAYCLDREALIAAAFPYLTEEQRAGLRMDATLPKAHWAYKGPYTFPDYAPDKGMALLDEAGWIVPDGETIRENDAGDRLALKMTTTTAPYRQAWGTAAAHNMAACGIELVAQYTEASWWLGDESGLARRDFELGAFSWVGTGDPMGRTLYACDMIPVASNGWMGQNYMGWCNEAASKAIIAVSNTVDRKQRISSYDTFHKLFANDLASLPLFQIPETEAWAAGLEGIRNSATEDTLASAGTWKLKGGGDKLVIGLTKEPETLFELVDSSAVTRELYKLAVSDPTTQFDYADQPVIQSQLSTIDSGLSANGTVDVRAGDQVYTSGGTRAALEKGVKVFDAQGQEVTFDGSTPVTMKQLTSEYKFKDYTWSDGAPGSAKDLDLGYLVDCDPNSGNTSYATCAMVQEFKAGPALEYTIKWLPGAQPWRFETAPFHIYPSHQDVTGSRKLSDVPAPQWSGLPEVAQKPLSIAPFVLTEWKKGESMTFTRNKFYQPAPALQTIEVRFFADGQAAVKALAAGEIAYIDKEGLGTSAVQAALDAAKDGKIVVKTVASPTWEHLDFNLFTK